LYRNNVRIAYNNKKNLKTLLFLLLFKRKKLQKKNFIAFKIKKQLRSQILSQTYLIYKKIVFFFYVILILDKILLKSELLRLHYNNALIKYFKIKKIYIFISKKFY